MSCTEEQWDEFMGLVLDMWDLQERVSHRSFQIGLNSVPETRAQAREARAELGLDPPPWLAIFCADDDSTTEDW